MRYTIPIFAVSLLTACGDDPPGEVGDFLPVAVGNRWVYNEIDVLGVRADQTDVKEITGTSEVGGVATFVMVSTQSLTEVVKTFDWRVGDGRVDRVRTVDSFRGQTVETIDYDPGFLRFSDRLRAVGDTLTEEHARHACDTAGICIDGTRSYTWTVLAVDEVITVPAGTFSCLKIRRQRAAGNFKEYWYAEGVGKVYEVGLANVEELIEYDVAE